MRCHKRAGVLWQVPVYDYRAIDGFEILVPDENLGKEGVNRSGHGTPLFLHLNMMRGSIWHYQEELTALSEQFQSLINLVSTSRLVCVPQSAGV